MAEHTGSEGRSSSTASRSATRTGTSSGAFSLTLFDTPEQMQALLQRVDFLDKKVNSYARRIKSASGQAIPSIPSSATAPPSRVQVLPAALRADRIAGPHPRRDRNRQRTGGQRNPHGEQPARRPLRQHQLRGHPEGAVRVGSLRLRARGLLRRAQGRQNRQIELADQGTLFLDEVGDLPLHAQVKLLRVLEEKTLSRLGSSQPRAVDFRLVAATNRDLKKMIAAGTFREDLYYRLNVVHIPIPPLRERREDIPLLVAHFAEKAAKENGIPPKTFSTEALNHLSGYEWPGNIRNCRTWSNAALCSCPET